MPGSAANTGACLGSCSAAVAHNESERLHLQGGDIQLKHQYNIPHLKVNFEVDTIRAIPTGTT